MRPRSTGDIRYHGRATQPGSRYHTHAWCQPADALLYPHFSTIIHRIFVGANVIFLLHLVRSPKKARIVRSEGGRLYTFPRHQGVAIDNTGKVPHEAALQILSFMNELILKRDEALVHDETTPMEATEPIWSARPS